MSQTHGGNKNNRGNRTTKRRERVISEKAEQEILTFLRDQHQQKNFNQYCNEHPELFGKTKGSPTSRALRKKVQQRFYNLKRKDSKYLLRKVSIWKMH